MVSVPLGGTPSGLGEPPKLSKSPQSTSAEGLLGGEERQSGGHGGPSWTSLVPQLTRTEWALDLALGHPDTLVNTSFGTEMNSSSLRGLFIFAYFSIIVVSLFGNALVCSVITKRKRVHSATRLFIVNLAVANIMITLLNTPFTLMSFVSSSLIFGYMMCHLSRFVQYCSVYVSVLTLTALALDRYQITIQPLKPRMTTMKGGIYIITIWILASCFSLPQAVYQRFPQINILNKTSRMACLPSFPQPSDGVRKYLDNITFICLYVVPLMVITVTYSLMAKKLWQRNSIRDTATENSISRQQKKKTTLKMLVMVVVVFALCWFPLHLYEVLLSSQVIHSHEAIYFAFHWLAMSSTCYNPFIYYWLNKSFRNELKLVLRSWWQKVLNHSQESPSMAATFCRTLRESYPFWNTSFDISNANEGPPASEQIDLSAIHPVVEKP